MVLVFFFEIVLAQFPVAVAAQGRLFNPIARLPSHNAPAGIPVRVARLLHHTAVIALDTL